MRKTMKQSDEYDSGFLFCFAETKHKIETLLTEEWIWNIKFIKPHRNDPRLERFLIEWILYQMIRTSILMIRYDHREESEGSSIEHILAFKWSVFENVLDRKDPRPERSSISRILDSTGFLNSKDPQLKKFSNWKTVHWKNSTHWPMK
jgi:hypothetical protein